MDSKRLSAFAAVFACMFFWGFSFISTKIALDAFGPSTLGAIRFALALLLLFILKCFLLRGEKTEKRDIPILALAGVSGVTLYFVCENNGVAIITASEASIITAAIPVIMIIIEAAMAKLSKRPSGLFLAAALTGSFISMAGVVMVAGASFSVSGNIAGYLFMAGSCVSWVMYSFLTRPLFAKYSRLLIVFWQTFFGFLGFLPFTAVEIVQGAAFFPEAVAGVWPHIAFLGVCCSALAYWFYARSLETLGIGISALFIDLIPVVTAVASFFILRERLSGLQWAGAALVIIGVYIATLKPRKVISF